MRTSSLPGVILLFLVGTLLYAVGIVSFVNAFTLSRIGAHARGTVFEDVQKTSTDKHGNPYVLHYPHVMFIVPDQGVYTFISDSGSSSLGYPVGQGVPVIYDSAHPSTARINDFMNMWFMPLVLLGMAALILFTMTLFIQRFLTDS